MLIPKDDTVHEGGTNRLISTPGEPISHIVVVRDRLVQSQGKMNTGAASTRKTRYQQLSLPQMKSQSESPIMALPYQDSNGSEDCDVKQEQAPEVPTTELLETEETKEEIVISTEDDVALDGVLEEPVVVYMSWDNLINSESEPLEQHQEVALEEEILSVRLHQLQSQHTIPHSPDIQTFALSNDSDAHDCVLSNEEFFSNLPANADIETSNSLMYNQSICDGPSQHETAKDSLSQISANGDDQAYTESGNSEDGTVEDTYEENIAMGDKRETTESHGGNDSQYIAAAFPLSPELLAQIHPEIAHHGNAISRRTHIKSVWIKREQPVDFVHHYRSINRMLKKETSVPNGENSRGNLGGKGSPRADYQVEDMYWLEELETQLMSMDMEVGQEFGESQDTSIRNPQPEEQVVMATMAMDISPVGEAVAESLAGKCDKQEKRKMNDGKPVTP